MTVAVKGTQYIFGIPTTQITITGLVLESATLRSSVQVDEEGVNNLGIVEAYAIGGIQYEVTVSGKFTGNPPTPGTKFVAQGVTLYMTNVETSWANRDWKKASITAKGYDGITT
jgi:hypothetical protein